MSLLGTVTDILRFVSLVLGWTFFALIFIYLSMRLGFVAYFKSKSQVYRNRNKKQSKKHEQR